jgi:hypothetical protein
MSTLWLLRGFVLLVVFFVGVPAGQAGDWLDENFPFATYNPLRLPTKQWVRLSVKAGEYRTAVEQDGDDSVARAMAIVPSILVMPPDTNVQPYVGAGVGLSLTDMMPGAARVPLHLEESLVLHVGGGIAYHLGRSLALTSSASFAHFKTLDLLSQFASSQLPLNLDGRDFNFYTVEFGFRLLY